MRDFLKILIGLVLLAGAFNFGRNFENRQSQEAALEAKVLDAINKKKAVEAKVDQVKEQFQSLFNETENTSTERVFGQILTILITQLDVKLSEEQMNRLSANKATESASRAQAITTQKKRRAQDGQGKILNMQAFLQGAEPIKKDRVIGLSGQYKGRIVDLKNQTYAAVSLRLKADMEPEGMHLQMQISRDGNVQDTKIKDSIGLTQKHKTDWLIEHEPGRFIYFSNAEKSQKLRGDYYEVMPQGTTKLIGKVDLTRIDL